MNRRSFIKTGLIYVPTIFACHGGIVRMGNLEPEVGSWMARLIARSGHYTSPSVVANDWMIKGLKASNLRSSIVWLNTFTGVGLASAIAAPLICDVNPSQADGSVNLDEEDYSESVGMTGNGTNEFLFAGCKQSDLYALDSVNHSFSYGLYVCASNNQSGFGMGVYNGADFIYLYVSNAGATTFFSTGISGNQITAADSAGTGFYCGSFNTTTDAKLYKRGVEIGTSATPGATYSSTYWVGVLDVNNQNSNNPVAPSTKTWGGYMCARGIAAASQPALNDVWKRGMGILGRPVV